MRKKCFGLVLTAMISVGCLFTGMTSANAAEERVSDGNDSFDTATWMDVNGSVTDTIFDNKDEDFFRLSPSTNGVLNISFEHTYKDSEYGWGG